MRIKDSPSVYFHKCQPSVVLDPCATMHSVAWTVRGLPGDRKMRTAGCPEEPQLSAYYRSKQDESRGVEIAHLKYIEKRRKGKQAKYGYTLISQHYVCQNSPKVFKKNNTKQINCWLTCNRCTHLPSQMTLWPQSRSKHSLLSMTHFPHTDTLVHCHVCQCGADIAQLSTDYLSFITPQAVGTDVPAARFDQPQTNKLILISVTSGP